MNQTWGARSKFQLRLFFLMLLTLGAQTQAKGLLSPPLPIPSPRPIPVLPLPLVLNYSGDAPVSFCQSRLLRVLHAVGRNILGSLRFGDSFEEGIQRDEIVQSYERNIQEIFADVSPVVLQQAIHQFQATTERVDLAAADVEAQGQVSFLRMGYNRKLINSVLYPAFTSYFLQQILFAEAAGEKPNALEAAAFGLLRVYDSLGIAGVPVLQNFLAKRERSPFDAIARNFVLAVDYFDKSGFVLASLADLGFEMDRLNESRAMAVFRYFELPPPRFSYLNYRVRR